MGEKSLQQLRSEIDSINQQLFELLNERGTIALEIGKAKKAQGMSTYDPVREQEILDAIAEKNKGPFDTATLQDIFKQIFKSSLALQEEGEEKDC